MKLYIKHFLIIIGIVLSINLSAQDAQFSQYYAAPLNLSPSFTGSGDGIRMMFNHRVQWPLIKDLFTAYNTSSLGVDYFIPSFSSGVGILGTATAAGNGLLIKSKFAGLYSFNAKIIKGWYFRPGVEFSYNRIDYNFDKLTFGDEIANGRETSEEDPNNFVTGKGVFDMGASALVYSKLYWGGMTIAHLLQPNESVVMSNSNANTKVPMKFLVYGGAKIDLNGRLDRDNEESLFASFLYRGQQEFDQFDIGAYWLRMPILMGIWYRGLPGFQKNKDKSINHDAVVLVVGFKKNRIGVSFSYDVTVSSLFLDSGGAYELALNYLLVEQKSLKRRPKRVLVPCPRF